MSTSTISPPLIPDESIHTVSKKASTRSFKTPAPVGARPKSIVVNASKQRKPKLTLDSSVSYGQSIQSAPVRIYRVVRRLPQPPVAPGDANLDPDVTEPLQFAISPSQAAPLLRKMSRPLPLLPLHNASQTPTQTPNGSENVLSVPSLPTATAVGMKSPWSPPEPISKALSSPWSPEKRLSAPASFSDSPLSLSGERHSLAEERHSLQEHLLASTASQSSSVTVAPLCSRHSEDAFPRPPLIETVDEANDGTELKELKWQLSDVPSYDYDEEEDILLSRPVRLNTRILRLQGTNLDSDTASEEEIALPKPTYIDKEHPAQAVADKQEIDEEAIDHSWILSKRILRRHLSTRLEPESTSKWIREKNGKRTTEDNYESVLHILRAL